MAQPPIAKGNLVCLADYFDLAQGHLGIGRTADNFVLAGQFGQLGGDGRVVGGVFVEDGLVGRALAEGGGQHAAVGGVEGDSGKGCIGELAHELGSGRADKHCAGWFASGRGEWPHCEQVGGFANGGQQGAFVAEGIYFAAQGALHSGQLAVFHSGQAGWPCVECGACAGQNNDHIGGLVEDEWLDEGGRGGGIGRLHGRHQPCGEANGAEQLQALFFGRDHARGNNTTCIKQLIVEPLLQVAGYELRNHISSYSCNENGEQEIG